ncbi:MAG: SRPBCC family protein [Chloroflexota bacterium]
MSLIDQRILIEAPLEAIWPYVAAPALITKWNRIYKQIQVLSTKSTGVNTRRRCTGENGKSVVEEITAWLENIGYEYHVVDGPYQTYRGRFRLQAIPEGTIVNWTIEYKLRGPMSGVRNLISFRRQQEDLMADSLRALRRLVEATGIRLDPSEHARFALQAAPSVEARFSRTQSGDQVGQTGSMKPVSVTDNDIPDLIADQADVIDATGDFVPSFAAEPEATTHMPAIAALDDTKPRPPQGLTDSQEIQQGNGLRQSTPDKSKVDDASAFTVPISLVAPPRPPEPDTQTLEFVTHPAPPEAPYTLPERIPTSPMPAIQDSDLVKDKRGTGNVNVEVNKEKIALDKGGKHDTKDMSIWDVFGMERPSDRTQIELESLLASIQRRAEESPDAPEAQSTQPAPPAGLKAALGTLPPSSPADHNAPAHSRYTRKAVPPVRALRRGPPRQKMTLPVKRARR